MILVNSTYTFSPASDSDHNNKRQEILEENEFVDSIIDEINTLILSNKKTYEDPEKFEEIEKSSSLKKRDSESHPLMDYGDSDYVYPVANLNDKTLLYAYLSNDLIETVKSLPNVISVDTPIEYKPDSTINRERDIQNETQWKKVSVEYYADLHLSLISQGKYSDDLIGQYDTNYYYPSSAGEDVDIFIFDTGFNFRHSEFNNKNSRTVKCAVNIVEGKAYDVPDETYCMSNYRYDMYMERSHGTMVATVAGGMIRGVAKKANIYGILIDYYFNLNVIAGLRYVKEHLFRPGKAIFNFSFGRYIDMDRFENESLYIEYKNLIKEMTEEGAIFICSAGNENAHIVDNEYKLIKEPCSIDGEICVGGIGNPDDDTRMMKSNQYVKDIESNYGKEVDLYAPYHVQVEYQDNKFNYVNKSVCGTSFSAPIVAGVAATIISENPGVQYNSWSMLKHLTEIGEKDIITDLPKGDPNVFINNGKHTVYSNNDTYMGCGVYSGNMKCPNHEVCSTDGHCVKRG
ncbi:subtilisin-like protein [Neocallimastix californiae]|jgi:subtilisin family serine protease|uniref:Subtilisin-like protein n=1 Tax=Neocallimastix californiae TaxID=1754190 RepID=A0A1Y2AUV4_9FUNG|nr:subtilisin-like protein [Neocallimastix californiae]|eukprot:ORY26378.1 subtilisin-like protein [Neocallimastix californiae]